MSAPPRLSPAVFMVMTTGELLSFELLKITFPFLTLTTILEEQTQTLLTLSAVLVGDAGVYRVEVTNDADSAT